MQLNNLNSSMLIGFFWHMDVCTPKEKPNGYYSAVSALSDFVMNIAPEMRSSLSLFIFCFMVLVVLLFCLLVINVFALCPTYLPHLFQSGWNSKAKWKNIFQAWIVIIPFVIYRFDRQKTAWPEYTTHKDLGL